MKVINPEEVVRQPLKDAIGECRTHGGDKQQLIEWLRQQSFATHSEIIGLFRPVADCSPTVSTIQETLVVECMKWAATTFTIMSGVSNSART